MATEMAGAVAAHGEVAAAGNAVALTLHADE
jgi:hypothetical protein